MARRNSLGRRKVGMVVVIKGSVAFTVLAFYHEIGARLWGLNRYSALYKGGHIFLKTA
jgi:hypothetical protein